MQRRWAFLWGPCRRVRAGCPRAMRTSRQVTLVSNVHSEQWHACQREAGWLRGGTVCAVAASQQDDVSSEAREDSWPVAAEAPAAASEQQVDEPVAAGQLEVGSSGEVPDDAMPDSQPDDAPLVPDRWGSLHMHTF
jgi:hypothetical protein